MAGFDFEFSYDDESSYELARRLLHHLQWRSRYFGLELHYRVRRVEAIYYVIVDGPLPGMQAFVPRLTLEVFACAEFAEEPKPAWRRTDVAWELANAYRAGVEKMTGSIHRLHRQLTPVFGRLAPSPLSFQFDLDGVPTHVHGPLRRFESTLMIYANLPVMLLPTVPVEEAQVVEEAHTATELVLRVALGVHTLSYEQMADRARDRGWVDAEQHRLLIQLKNVRKRVKHRGQGVPLLTGYDMVMNAAACCHQLLAEIAGRPSLTRRLEPRA